MRGEITLEKALDEEVKFREGNQDWAGLISLYHIFGYLKKNLILRASHIVDKKEGDEWGRIALWLKEKNEIPHGLQPLTVNDKSLNLSVKEKQAIMSLRYYLCLFYCNNPLKIPEEIRQDRLNQYASYLEGMYGMAGACNEINFTIHVGLGVAKAHTSTIEQAFDHFKLAKNSLSEFCGRYPTHRQKGHLAFAESTIYLSYRQYEKSLPSLRRQLYFSELLMMERPSLYWSYIFEASELLCFASNELGDYQEARLHGERALSLLKKYDSIYLSNLGNYRVLHNYAIACHYSGNSERAIKYFRVILEWDELDVSSMNFTKTLLATTLLSMLKLEQAKPLLEECIDYYEKADGRCQNLASLYRHYGDLFRLLEEYDLACDALKKSVSMFECLISQKLVYLPFEYVNSLVCCGYVYYLKGDYVESYDYLKKSLTKLNFCLSIENNIDAVNLEEILKIFCFVCNQFSINGDHHYALKLYELVSDKFADLPLSSKAHGLRPFSVDS